MFIAKPQTAVPTTVSRTGKECIAPMSAAGTGAVQLYTGTIDQPCYALAIPHA